MSVDVLLYTRYTELPETQMQIQVPSFGTQFKGVLAQNFKVEIICETASCEHTHNMHKISIASVI